MNHLNRIRKPHQLFCVIALLALGTWIVSCNSGSPTEPDSVAAVADSAGSSSGSSGNANNSGNSGSGNNSGGSNNGSNSNGANNPGNSGSSGTQTGTLTLTLTDLPTDEICQLWVYFAELRVKPDGESAQVIPLQFPPEAYDLLTLRNGNEEEMGEFGITQGKYQFIEILLDQGQSYVVEKDPDNDCSSGIFGDTVALQIPSEKFKVKGNPFTVDDNTEILIDFDADKSLKRKGSSKNPKGWQLKPEVTIAGVDP